MTSHKQKKVELYVNTKQMSLPEFEEEKFIFVYKFYFDIL